MAVANPGFETEGTLPGEADSWNIVTVATLVTIATFDTTTPQAFEDFEQEWSGNEGFLFSFDETASTPALFHSSDGLVEDFEREWLGNENFVTTIQAGVNGTAGSFDTGLSQLLEDFEQEWSGNENYAFVFPTTGVTAGVFNAANDPFESFEQEWKGNESYLFSLFAGPTTTAEFDVANTLVEDFEDEWPTLLLTTV